MTYLRSQCKPGAMDNKTLMFEFTRKTFHDSFPLPCNFTSNQEIYGRTFFSEIDCL